MAEESNVLRYLCKYHVKALVFMLDDEKIEMDASNILSIEYLCDYEMNIRSILKVGLRLDVRKRMWILKHKRKIVCKFELCKSGIDTDQDSWVRNLETVWNEEFGIYLNDEDEAIDVKVLEERLKLNDPDTDASVIDDENYFESQNMCDVFLFNQKLLNASMTTYNDVYTENIMQNFVGRLLTKTKHHKVLMSPFENDEVYKEVLVPALPAYKALAYLDQYYGFYKKGSMIFYDIDVLYILNANGKCTAKREDEWQKTTLLVTRLDTSVPGNGMVLREGEETSYLALPDDYVGTRRFTMINNGMWGSEAKMVITDDTTIETEDADQSYIDQRNKALIFQHEGDNKYNAEMLKARMEEVETVLYLSGDNMDIRCFTPNREFTAIFDEESKQMKYGVDGYRIAYAYHYIRLESEGYMTSSHRVILKRRLSDEEGSDDDSE